MDLATLLLRVGRPEPAELRAPLPLAFALRGMGALRRSPARGRGAADFPEAGAFPECAAATAGRGLAGALEEEPKEETDECETWAAEESAACSSAATAG